MPSKTPSIALGAIISIVLSMALSFGMLSMGPTGQMLAGCGACLLAVVGPLVAVWHYTSTHHLTIPAGPGASLGAITGAVAAVVGGLLQQGLILVGLYPNAAEVIERQRQGMIDSGMDPAQIEQSMQMAEQMGGMTSNPLIGILIGLVFGAVLGAIGGAIGAALFKKGPLEAEI